MSAGGGFLLDRMAIEEAGPNPERLAAAIHDQLALRCGPTPIRQIAAALEIVEIREARLKSFEAALIAPPERGEESILVNADSHEYRRRFSIAHELGHFLNLWHRPIETREGCGFACRKDDLGTWTPRASEASVHALQEAQANRFAIELLAPRKFFKGFLSGIPDLEAVMRLHTSLQLSKEAVARHYVELRDEPIAIVFTRDGAVRSSNGAATSRFSPSGPDRRRLFFPLPMATMRSPRMKRPIGATGSAANPTATSSSKPCTSATASPSRCL